MEKQTFGSEAPLQKTYPLNVEHNGSTGKPTKQFFGSEAPISTKPVELQQFNTNSGNMEKQLFGSEAPLDTSAHHGWESYNTPMSERAKKQSK